MLYRAIVSRSISTSPRRYPDGTPGAFKNSGGVPSHAESIALSAPLGGPLPKPEVQNCNADKPIGMVQHALRLRQNLETTLLLLRGFTFFDPSFN